jgi:cell division protein FtsZ
MNENNFDTIAFEMPKNQYNAIKVIGVGGGGSNAVNYMFQQGIGGVDFVICNTDAQALENSPIPIANKIQLGINLTDGMGAGANPDIGAKAAEESYNELKKVLSTNTKMVFITAGMGGGTGTGAAPIIAKIAKDLSLLTVGIVTIPFEFEGKSRISQAQKGIEKLRGHVDSLIIINNNKLREVYGNLGYKSGFSKADEVLSIAASGIAEVITHHYKHNIDLNDAKTVLSNSGTAIMGSATATGPDRAKNAVVSALDSPLLNDNKITGAKNVLLLIVSGNQEVTLDEIGEINEYVRSEAGNDVNIIMGVGDETNLEDAITVTVVATGFSSGQQHHITNTEVKKIVHTLEDSQGLLFDLSDDQPFNVNPVSYIIEEEENEEDLLEEDIVMHHLEEENEDGKIDFEYVITTDSIKNIEMDFETISSDDDDFIIKLVEEKIPQKKENLAQTELSFDFQEQSTAPIVATTKEINDIKVQDALLFHNDSDKNVIFNLSDYSENISKQPSTISKNVKIEDAELLIELKSNEVNQTLPFQNELNFGSEKESISPLNTPISELNKTNEKRKEYLRQHNYVFPKGLDNIEEFEKEPAYKRMNVDLSDNSNTNDVSFSRTSVDFNENGIQLRTNNPFLNDNVD